ncbi:MAG: hypothetical protein MZU79_05435 [Anaerotruncus sp.]|nr:hypothetical protein [Anaerotruncus sp.]
MFPTGWGLVRASNTQAVIVLRFEADTEADLAAIQKEVRGVLAAGHQPARDGHERDATSGPSSWPAGGGPGSGRSAGTPGPSSSSGSRGATRCSSRRSGASGRSSRPAG